jgi:DNA-binding transcriptional LysR family regulator
LAIKLSQIIALVTIAKCGKFSQAAEELELTQPTVSHSIALLEEELGIQLLFRGRRGVKLTPGGESVLIHCQQILDSVDKLYREANRHKSLGEGRVRISTFRGAAAQLLPKIKAEFKAKYPQIEVQIAEEKDCPQVENAVREGTADIGFTILPTPDDLETIEILRDPYIILLPPDSEFKSIPQLTWEQLITLPLISYPSRNSCFIEIDRYVRQHGYRFNPCEQVRNSETIINLVATGSGSAILPKLSVFHIPEGVTVCDLPHPLVRIVVAATLAEANLSHAVWAFLDFLKQN